MNDKTDEKTCESPSASKTPRERYQNGPFQVQLKRAGGFTDKDGLLTIKIAGNDAVKFGYTADQDPNNNVDAWSEASAQYLPHLDVITGQIRRASDSYSLIIFLDRSGSLPKEAIHVCVIGIHYAPPIHTEDGEWTGHGGTPLIGDERP